MCNSPDYPGQYFTFENAHPIAPLAYRPVPPAGTPISASVPSMPFPQGPTFVQPVFVAYGAVPYPDMRYVQQIHSGSDLDFGQLLQAVNSLSDDKAKLLMVGPSY